MKMMSDPEIRTFVKLELVKSARLHTLRFLRLGAGKLNDGLLRTLLHASGHRLSYDEIRDLAAWLADRGYMTVGNFEWLEVYTLTRKGDDAASGVILDDGLASEHDPIELGERPIG